MSIIGDLAQVAAPAAGGLIGIGASILGHVVDIFKAKEDRRTLQLQQQMQRDQMSHELEMSRLNAANSAQAAADERQAASEAAGAAVDQTVTSGSFAGLIESIKADAAIQSGYRWVLAVKALTRPWLTFMLWILFAITFWQVLHSSESWASHLDKDGLIKYFVDTIGFMATTATAWWFGDRVSTRRLGTTGPQS